MCCSSRRSQCSVSWLCYILDPLTLMSVSYIYCLIPELQISQCHITLWVIVLGNKKNKPSKELDWKCSMRHQQQFVCEGADEMRKVCDDFSVCAAIAHLKAPVFQMNTVTSALISGVIILGAISVCFFIFSLTLLKGKSTPISSLSGVRNPAFN